MKTLRSWVARATTCPRLTHFRQWGEGWVVRLTGKIPHPLLANPERVLLNVAFVLIGLSALVPPPGSLIAGWDDRLAWTWGTIMSTGGFAGLLGQWRDFRPAERVGALGVAAAAFSLALWLTIEFGTVRLPTAIIFFGIFIAKLIRLLRTSAARFAVQRHLRELEENGGFE